PASTTPTPPPTPPTTSSTTSSTTTTTPSTPTTTPPPTTTTSSTTSSTTTTTTTLPCQCHDVCTPGPAECATGCDPCVALVCAQHPTCCDPTLSWTDLCVSEAQDICCPNSNLSCCMPG